MIDAPNVTWTVYVDDNFHFMDESERYRLGSFDQLEDAVSACRDVVEAFLRDNTAKTAKDLFKSYVAFGDDPWIKSSEPDRYQAHFSAWA